MTAYTCWRGGVAPTDAFCLLGGVRAQGSMGLDEDRFTDDEVSA